MVLNTMQKVVAITGAVVTALGLTYGITSIAEDTAAGPNAAVVDCKFKYFNHKHGAELSEDANFKAVFNFFKNPYSAKLFRVVDGETVSYIYVAKGEKDAEGNWTAESWKAYKNTAKDARSSFAVNGNNIQELLNNKDVLKDWEAVNVFMKDWKESHKVTDDTQADEAVVVNLGGTPGEPTEEKKATDTDAESDAEAEDEANNDGEGVTVEEKA